LERRMIAVLRLYVEYLVTAAAAMVAVILFSSVLLLCIIVPIFAKVLVVVVIVAFILVLVRLSPSPDYSSKSFSSPLPPPSSGPTASPQSVEIRRPDQPQLIGATLIPLELQGIPERLQLNAAPEDPITVGESLLQIAAEDEDNFPEDIKHVKEESN
jgi:hypothetical protein